MGYNDNTDNFNSRWSMTERPAGQQPQKRRTRGHDTVIGALQESGRQATIITLGGEEFTGKVIGRDDYTITLLIGPTRMVFYKHGIERFFGEEAQSR